MKNNFKKKETNESIVNEIRPLLNKMNYRKGGEYIIHLLQNPNRQFPYFYLEYGNTKKDLGQTYIHDLDYLQHVTDYLTKTPILMCDDKTKKEVQQRLNEVLQRIANAEKVGSPNDLYDLMEEKNCLIKYLAEVLGTHGKIRYFQDSLVKPKRAVLQNIRRFFKELTIQDPCLTNKLENKIKTSRYTICSK